jgi:acetyl-CoA acetyltransferase
MGIGPVPATQKLMARLGLSIEDFDAVELNEAFASQAIICCEELKFPMERVNPNGGAIALGHALGATGGVLTTKAAYWMKHHPNGKKYALVTMCVGGGEGSAALFERP